VLKAVGKQAENIQPEITIASRARKLLLGLRKSKPNQRKLHLVGKVKKANGGRIPKPLSKAQAAREVVLHA